MIATEPGVILKSEGSSVPVFPPESEREIFLAQAGKRSSRLPELGDSTQLPLRLVYRVMVDGLSRNPFLKKPKQINQN